MGKERERSEFSAEESPRFILKNSRFGRRSRHRCRLQTRLPPSQQGQAGSSRDNPGPASAPPLLHTLTLAHLSLEQGHPVGPLKGHAKTLRTLTLCSIRMTKGELAGRIQQVERVVGTRACRLGRVVSRDVDAKGVGLERGFVGQGGWQGFGVALRNE